MKKAALAARLRATFLGELEEQVRSMNAQLLALEEDAAAAEPLRSLFRSAHTLKGAARAAGFQLVEEVCHSLETLLAKAREGAISLSEADFHELFAAVDAIGDAGARLRAGGDLDGSPLELIRGSPARSFAPLSEETGSGAPGAPLASPAVPEPPAAPRPPRVTGSMGRPGEARAEVKEMPAAPSGGATSEPEPTSSQPESRPPVESKAELRVEPERLDGLVATVGELRAAASRVSGRTAELDQLHELVGRISDEWARAAHPLEQAVTASGLPASAIRHVREMSDELRRLSGHTRGLAREARKDARSVARLTEEFGAQVRTIRMRPFSDACEPLPRLVRDLATAARKEVRLEIRGEEVEADREVWKAIADALLHLVTNAIDHGIEEPEARVAAGKPSVGTVRIAAAVRGDRVVVAVSDDGAGLDVEALRTQLERAGVRPPDDDGEVLRLIFRGGISTRAETTLISGRGVGLDSARHAVERARGTIRAESRAGAGATFNLECALTLIGLRAVLASVGTQTVAIPSASVRRLLRIRPADIHRVEGRDMITTETGPVRLVALSRILGPPLVDSPVVGPFPVLLMADGDRTAAVAVDELLNEQELLVRPLKRIRNPPAYLAGAAILPAGRVVLALNPATLVEAAFEERAHPRISAPREEGVTDRPTVLVVDDSITTRTLEQSILESAGYEVITAADGADAWRLLQEHDCDLVVSDVEMPRMDGFALCEAIRASRRLQALPIVLVTALESPGQRARGLEVGADAYLPKSSFDQDQLVETIRELIG